MAFCICLEMSSGASALPYIPVGLTNTINMAMGLTALSLYICRDWSDKLAEDEHEEEKFYLKIIRL